MAEPHFSATGHPYLAVGALLCITADPEVISIPLRLTGSILLLPSRVLSSPFKVFKVLGRFILYILGFRRDGVVRGTSSINYRICPSPVEHAIDRFICISIPVQSLQGIHAMGLCLIRETPVTSGNQPKG
jgi:hypothetical protein